MKSNSKKSVFHRMITVCSASFLTVLVAGPATAGPTGGEVVQGDVTIQRVTSTLTNIEQASDRAVVNWDDFSLDVDETIIFQQPGASAAILNRVIGPDMSVIAGQIFANGQVFLINANGIAFSGTSYVDVNGLVATTANVADSAFMAGGAMAFDAAGQSDATISVSAGAQILAGDTAGEAGLVAMIAPGVEHSGIIQANLGQVVIGGAETFTMDLNGDGLYSFALGGSVGTALANGSVVDVSGDIVSEAGTVLIQAAVASELVGNAINLTGQIFARSAGVDQLGNIILRAGCEDGTAGCGNVVLAEDALLDVSGDAGGNVSLSGRSIDVQMNAEINASGAQRGGSISVTSDGSDSDDSLVMDGNLFADADAGDAGVVALQASNGSDLNAGGGVSATGNAGSGTLTFEGGANNGGYAVGTIIQTSGQTSYIYNGTSALSIGSSQNTAMPFVDTVSVNSALRSGNSVIVDVGGALSIDGLIDGREETIPTSASADLTITSADDVTVSGDCGASGPCGVVLVDSNLSVTTTGDVTMDDTSQPSLLSTGNGSSGSTGSISIRSEGDVVLQDVVTSGLLAVNTSGSNVTLARELGGPQAVGGTASIGGVGVNANGANAIVTLNALKTGDGGVDATSAGVLNVDGQIESAGQVDLSGVTVYLRRSIFTAGSNITISGTNPDGAVLLDPTGETFASPQGGPLGDYVIPVREITVSTGSDTGNVTISGSLDIIDDDRNLRTLSYGVYGVEDFDNPDTPDVSGPYTSPFGYDPETMEFESSRFYVTLNVSAGQRILFRDGIASGRVIRDSCWGDCDGVLSSDDWADPNFFLSTNTLSLVIQNGELDLSDNNVESRLVLNRLKIQEGGTVLGRSDATNSPLDGDQATNSIFGANPEANVFLINGRTVYIQDEQGNSPPTPPAPGDFSANPDPSAGTSVPTPDGSSVPGGPNPGGGNPGGVDPRQPPESPTGTAPDTIDDPSRIAGEQDGTVGGTGVAVGGQGAGSNADLGTDTQNSGAASDIFATNHHVVDSEACVQTDEQGNCIESSVENDYLSQGVFEGVESGVLR